MPRFGSISGMGSPPDWKPARRSSEVSRDSDTHVSNDRLPDGSGFYSSPPLITVGIGREFARFQIA